MSRKPRILVLMTTYNGQAYLAEQLDSIFAQEGVDVFLRVSDDCSTDSTYRILETYASEHENMRISLNSENLGCNGNFMQLIYEADPQAYDFFAISDQDDVWLPDKLRIAASHITSNTSRPELYYAGVDNFTTEGEDLGNEEARYKSVADNPLSLLLVQNWALGCTTLLNPALIKLLQRYHAADFGRVYDAWYHAVALYCGGYVYCDLDHAYIRRRITGNNVMGLMNEDRSVGFLIKQAAHWFFHRDDERATKHTKMARCLLEGYRDYMDEDTTQVVYDVAERETSFAARWRLFRRKDIVMPSRMRTLWLRWMVLFNRF